jgi:hypothetical protein
MSAFGTISELASVFSDANRKFIFIFIFKKAGSGFKKNICACAESTDLIL